MLELDFCTGLVMLGTAAVVNVPPNPTGVVFAGLPVCTALAEFFLRLDVVRSSFSKRVIALSAIAMSVIGAAELRERDTAGAMAELVPKNRIRNGCTLPPLF